MSEFGPVISGIAHGFKDSLIGTTALFRLNSALDERGGENQFKLADHRRASLRVRSTNVKKAERFVIQLRIHATSDFLLIK